MPKEWKDKKFDKKMYKNELHLFYGKKYENSMHSDVVKSLSKILQKLDAAKGSKLVVVDIYNKKFLASGSRKRMDIVVAIKELFDSQFTPGSTSCQLVGEGEPVEKGIPLDEKDLVQLRTSLDMTLSENGASRAYGFLYNQYEIQFVLAETQVHYISKVMSWKDDDCLRFLHYFAFGYSLVDEYKRILVRSFDEFKRIGCYPRALIGKGGSAAVFAVDYSNNQRSRRPRNGNEYSNSDSDNDSDSSDSGSSDSFSDSDNSTGSTSGNDSTTKAFKLYLTNDELDYPIAVDTYELLKKEILMYQYLQHQQYFNDFDRDMIVVYEYKNNDNRNKRNKKEQQTSNKA